MQTFSTLIVLAVAMVAATIAFTHGRTIPSQDYAGFTKMGGVKAKWYLASNYAADHDAALAECANFVGGRLATILSREEFNAVATTFPPSYDDYTTYWTAGRNVDGTWTWMTTNEAIEEDVLFWDGGGVYPIGTPGHVLSMRKYANLTVSSYSDSWGYTAKKKFVCEINTE